MSNPSDSQSQVTDDTTILVAPAPHRPIGVLLVEDDPMVREFLRMNMEGGGYLVETAETAEVALQILSVDFRSIVVADRNLPGMSGVELCRQVRQRMWPGYVYLLMLTGQDSEADVLEGLDAGADDYLSKRASLPQLLARLRTAQRIVSLEIALRDMAEERRRVAMTDSLTGAANRRYLMRHLGREVTRAIRHDEELSVLALDVDHFKRVNDAHGHAVGDEVLIQIVQRIRSSLPREQDWCARTGGEEFVVVLPHTGMEGARIVAHRILESVSAAPMRIDGQHLNVTVSIGVATLAAVAPHGSRTLDSMLKLADDCLYHSKRGGRNRITLPPVGSVSVTGS